MGNCLHLCQGSERKGRDNSIQYVGFSARIMFCTEYLGNYIKIIAQYHLKLFLKRYKAQDTRCR